MSLCPHVTAKEGILFNEVRTEFCGQSQAVFNRGLLLCERLGKKAFSFWDVLFTNKSKNNQVDIYTYLTYKRKKKKRRHSSDPDCASHGCYASEMWSRLHQAFTEGCVFKRLECSFAFWVYLFTFA